jgi:hypothetical protein
LDLTFAYDIAASSWRTSNPLHEACEQASHDLNSNNPLAVEPESGDRPCDVIAVQSVRRRRDNFIVSHAISNFRRAA